MQLRAALRSARLMPRGAVFTEGEGINDRGDIVGLYRSSDGVTHGFLLRDGNFTSINNPGAAYTDARGVWTTPTQPLRNIAPVKSQSRVS